MEEIAAWLRAIIAAVLLAGFLELLLPENDLKGVARLVLGLLIITIMVQPLSKIMRLPTALIWSLPTISNIKQGNPSTEQVMKEGLAWRNKWTAELNRNQQEFYEKKLRNLLGLIDEIAVADIKTKFKGEQVIGVKVELLAAKTSLKPAVRNRIKAQIKNAVELIYNGPVTVEVKWDE